MNAQDTPATPASRKGGWQASSWLHLVWLSVLCFQPVFDPGSTALDWVLVAGVIAVFVPLYVGLELRPERGRWWFTVPVTLLGMATIPFNSGASVLLVYAGVAAGLSETRRNALRWLVGLTVLWIVQSSLPAGTALAQIPMPWRLWGIVPPLLFIWLIGLIQIEQAEQDRAGAELRVQNARIGHLATMAERERIARDLHDLLGHSLTSVVVRAQVIQQLADTDPSRVRKEAAEVEDAARDALTEVRNAVRGWREADLDAELEAARETLAAAGVELTVHREPDLGIVGSAEHELALALREAVTNVARHARARTCRVDLDAHGDELRLVVADDGVGGTAREGSGLTGIRERIAALGGRVERVGTAGTTITVAIPLQVAT